MEVKDYLGNLMLVMSLFSLKHLTSVTFQKKTKKKTCFASNIEIALLHVMRFVGIALLESNEILKSSLYFKKPISSKPSLYNIYFQPKNRIQLNK